MNDCVRADVRDMLPDLVHDNLSAGQRTAVEDHLAVCADCAAELDLLHQMRRSLDTAPAVNVARISSAVAGIVPPAERLRDRRRAPVWLAAAVAVIAAGALALAIARSDGGIERNGAVPSGVAGRAQDTLTAPAVDTLTGASTKFAARPDSVAAPSRSQDRRLEGRAGAEIVFGGGVGDLDDTEIEALINDVGGITGTIDAEPEPVVPVFGERVSGERTS
ncbi:MAG: anti-sigma factor [Gemmatimonadaceae bacterium]